MQSGQSTLKSTAVLVFEAKSPLENLQRCCWPKGFKDTSVPHNHSDRKQTGEEDLRRLRQRQVLVDMGQKWAGHINFEKLHLGTPLVV